MVDQRDGTAATHGSPPPTSATTTTADGISSTSPTDGAYSTLERAQSPPGEYSTLEAAGSPGYGYSTLEVSPESHLHLAAGGQKIDPSTLPQPLPPLPPGGNWAGYGGYGKEAQSPYYDGSTASPNTWYQQSPPPPPHSQYDGYDQSVGAKSIYSQAGAGAAGIGAGGYDHPPPSSAGGVPPGQKRACGLPWSRRRWLLVALALLLLIGAIVGGVVGGVVSHKSKNNDKAANTGSGSNSTSPSGSDGDGNSTSSSVTALSTDSRLAAVNWTDTTSYSHYAVFSQDVHDGLMVSTWDAKNQTWNAVNVSSAAQSSGLDSDDTRPMGSTPLAAVSTGPSDYSFQVDLFYLTTTLQIVHLMSTDQSLSSWKVGDLTASKKKADNGSDLAATWHRCSSDILCSGDLILVYEASGALTQLNSSSWSRETTITNMDAGSPLSMFLFIGNDATVGGANDRAINKTDLLPTTNSALRLYFTRDSGMMYEWRFYPILRTWSNSHSLYGGLATNPRPQIASAPFGHFWDISAVVLNSDGGLSSSSWNNATWSYNNYVSVSGSPSKTSTFSSIAQNYENHLYGIVGNTILEFRHDNDSPNSMIYVSTVEVLNTTTTTTSSSSSS